MRCVLRNPSRLHCPLRRVHAG